MSTTEFDDHMAHRLEDLYAGRQAAAQNVHPMDDAYTNYKTMLSGAMQAQTAITDHAEASAKMLEDYARKIRGGTSPEDLGPAIELLGRIMARRT